jgi:hypothetical protein
MQKMQWNGSGGISVKTTVASDNCLGFVGAMEMGYFWKRLDLEEYW